MLTNNIYSHYLALIFLGYKKKKLQVSVPYSRTGLQLLGQLQKCGVIQFFYIKHPTLGVYVSSLVVKKTIIIFLKYNNGQPTFTYFKNYWNLRKKISVAFNDYSQISILRLDTILLVKTSCGILSNNECRRAKLGGLLVCAIYL